MKLFLHISSFSTIPVACGRRYDRNSCPTCLWSTLLWPAPLGDPLDPNVISEVFPVHLLASDQITALIDSYEMMSYIRVERPEQASAEPEAKEGNGFPAEEKGQ